jgi:hypothetical protein
MALQHLRSSTADKRPTPAAMSDGQLALNTNLASPGLFFKDSNGDSVKIGPVHVGTTAPNVSPAVGGEAGNSLGEAWLDTTAANPILKVWNGSAFVAVQPVGTGTVVSTADTGTVTSTMILDGTILNADINASAAIVDTKLATIATGGKVSGTAITSGNISTSGSFTSTSTVTGTNLIPTGSGVPTNGIYLPAANSVAVATNGTSRLSIDASGSISINATGPKNPDGYNTTNFKFLTLQATTGGTDRGALLELVGTGGGSPGYWLGRIGFFSTGNSYPHTSIFAATDSGGSNGAALIFNTTTTANVSSPIERGRFRSDGTFEIKGAGTGGSSPGFSVNPSTPANSFVIDSSGRLGIGTSSPGGKLDVRDAGTTIPALGAVGTGLNVRRTDGAIGLIIGYENAVGGSYIQAQHTNGSAAAYPLYLQPNGGNVGIGTTSPGSNLDLAGTASRIRWDVNNAYTLATHGNAAFSTFAPSVQSAADYQFQIAGIERARIDSSGRLLVGTSTSTSATVNDLVGKTQIASSENAALALHGHSSTALYGADIVFTRSRSATIGTNTIVQNGDEFGRIYFTGANGTGFDYGASIQAVVDGTPGVGDMPGRIVLATTADGASTPTERMRITSGGDFYFNTTVTTKTTAGFRIENSGIPNVSRGSSGTFMEFFNSGNGSSIGTIINSSGTATAYNTTSDYRLKENIAPLVGAINRINNLQVRRFNFIANPDHIVDGFIAHEAQAVVPECVTGEKDAVDGDGNPVYQGIDQSKLVPLLTAALQEAVAKIESLEARLTAAGI